MRMFMCEFFLECLWLCVCVWSVYCLCTHSGICAVEFSFPRISNTFSELFQANTLKMKYNSQSYTKMKVTLWCCLLTLLQKGTGNINNRGTRKAVYTEKKKKKKTFDELVLV